jgi:ABC-type lipoprotein export system ATPase subunit
MIRVERVSKTYKSGRGRVHALSEVSFELGRGNRAAVIGKSGSGKTTLLNCLGGLERPDSGSVICHGLEIHAIGPKDLSRFQRQDVGFVFQHGNLLLYLTVFENIGLPLTLNGIVGKSRALRVEALLERIGLKDAGPAMPHELSGGEIQRVSAARAMAHSPRILLADEPTASLDSETGRNLVNLMLEMGRDQGCTMLITTHDPDVFRLADKKICLKDGKLIKEEP